MTFKGSRLERSVLERMGAASATPPRAATAPPPNINAPCFVRGPTALSKFSFASKLAEHSSLYPYFIIHNFCPLDPAGELCRRFAQPSPLHATIRSHRGPHFLHLFPASTMAMEKATQGAAREINRKLLQTIRSDWEFPNVENSTTPAGGEAIAYRERYYGTTDESGEEDAQGGTTTQQQRPPSDAYKFDSPDSVAGAIQDTLQQRKTRKRKRLEAELEVNEGLRFFQMRRNAWTRAVPRASVQPTGSATGASTGSSPTSFTSTNVSSTGTSNIDPATASNLPHSQSSPFSYPTQPELLTDVLVPVAPPLISPASPVRVTLSSRSHSELYARVVRDSRTPAVPINLADMTRAMVQGWKDEGNWPPKNSAPEPSIASRASRLTQALGTQDEAGAGHGLFANHRHLRQGVEGVKRVFRLSGGASSSSATAARHQEPSQSQGL
ncbi:hypothetical protein EJ06DRAFT_284045 [Trichodelitschia bisporula]|uniref:Gag1-like clamp domain-containing protein n=1 Tax=Trichodelitschia bisporula TaxID=703511 RepID=A0A6G1I5Q4_9PEZI|nr:hypothetical protein EJ06DRAFT_284045 [Trichodelitschia bisporula]